MPEPFRPRVIAWVAAAAAGCAAHGERLILPSSWPAWCGTGPACQEGDRNFCLPHPFSGLPSRRDDVRTKEATMNAVIYLVGLVVVVLFILSFLGLR